MVSKSGSFDSLFPEMICLLLKLHEVFHWFHFQTWFASLWHQSLKVFLMRSHVPSSLQSLTVKCWPGTFPVPLSFIEIILQWNLFSSFSSDNSPTTHHPSLLLKAKSPFPSLAITSSGSKAFKEFVPIRS